MGDSYELEVSFDQDLADLVNKHVLSEDRGMVIQTMREVQRLRDELAAKKNDPVPDPRLTFSISRRFR